MEAGFVLSAGRFFGTMIKLQEAGGIRLSETVYCGSQNAPLHAHELPFFCYVLHGVFSENYDSRKIDCSAGTLIFHPAGDHHSNRFLGTSVRCFNIEVSRTTFESVRDIFPLSPNRWNSHGLEPSIVALRMYREFRNPDEFSPLAIEGLSLELMAAGLRNYKNNLSQKAPIWLRKIRDELRERFLEEISFKHLAVNAGVHPVHLARSFRKFYGMTVGDFIRHARIESACLALVTNRDPISEIALANGFCDQSHFTKTFRRVIGMTPAHYRKLHHT